MTYRSNKELKPKNMKNSIRFTPETKINASQVAKIKIVWPISGCEINNKIIGDKIKKLYRYFKYRFVLLSKLNTKAITTIVKGFKTSIGWNLGKKNNSIHLFDPFTSIPTKGTSKSAMKQITKRNLEIKNNFLIFKYDIKKTIQKPIDI